jgi:hypothetical protein
MSTTAIILPKFSTDFSVGFYKQLVTGSKIGLDNLSMGIFFATVFFLMEGMVSNFNAKLLFLIGVFINTLLFYTVGYLCFKSEDKFSPTFPFVDGTRINFPLYMIAFAAAYWGTLNVTYYPSNTPMTLLFYAAMVFLYFLYVVFLNKVGVYTFALGSILFGMITGMGWARIIQSYVTVNPDFPSSSSGTSSSQIIDLTASKDVSCSAFRL